MPDFLMQPSLLISLFFAFAGLGVLPAFANEDSRAQGFATELNDMSCTPRHEVHQASEQQSPAPRTCEPLPVALDLRFMDDDYSSDRYDLPVALDLDWESGEP